MHTLIYTLHSILIIILLEYIIQYFILNEKIMFLWQVLSKMFPRTRKDEEKVLEAILLLLLLLLLIYYNCYNNHPLFTLHY